MKLGSPSPPLARQFDLIWSALWRAQALHLVMFIVLPALVAVAHVALGLTLLPFLLIGEGSRNVELGKQIAPLREPGCWIMLAECKLAARDVVALPAGIGGPRSLEEQPAIEAFMPLPSALTWRHVWLLAWLAWFLPFVVVRERRRRREAGT